MDQMTQYKTEEVTRLYTDFSSVLDIERESSFRPEGFSIDKISEEIVIYDPNRTKRPSLSEGKTACEGCRIKIEDSVMYSNLPVSGHAVLKVNKYSCMNPDISFDIFREKNLRGVHFCLWPTTEHLDIHECTYEDNSRTFDILGALETDIKHFSDKETRNLGLPESDSLKYLLVVKNERRAYKEQKIHGMYHAIVMNMYTSRIAKEKRFFEENSCSYIEYLNTWSPPIKIKDYGTVTLAVPIFMPRPLYTIIYPNNCKKDSINQLSKEERMNISMATSDISYAYSLLLPAMAMDFDYKMNFRLGPIGTMYISTMPNSQYTGGLERDRLYLCDSTPMKSAEILRSFFARFVNGIQPLEREPASDRLVRELCKDYFPEKFNVLYH